MRAIDDELRDRLACRYLDKPKHNKRLAREVMKTGVVVRNPAGYDEVVSKPSLKESLGR